jgi:hypothetical protein
MLPDTQPEQAVQVTIGRSLLRGTPLTLYSQCGHKVARIYRRAAAMMEQRGYAELSATYEAISLASSEQWRGTSTRSHVNRVLPCMAFSDFFGEWINNDEGILMLCFAACMAETGDLT